MIVTTGGRGARVPRSSTASSASSRTDSASKATFSTVYSKSAATSDAVSWSSVWLMVAMMPRSINFLMTSPDLTPRLRARSPTLTTSEIRTTRLLALGTVMAVWRCSLPGRMRFFFGLRGTCTSRSRNSAASALKMTFRFLPRLRPPGAAADPPGSRLPGPG